MRDKVNQAAKGIFEYSKSSIMVSVEELQLTLHANECYEGSFVVSNDTGKKMRGTISTDCLFLTFTNPFFEGEQIDISYTFYGDTLLPGDTIKGWITIVSDCGTRQIPLLVSVGVPSCEVSEGEIRDLFHFTNLAKEKPEEASGLFRDPNFVDVFLYRDFKSIALYRGLSKGTSKGMALEEFLIAIRKKLPVKLSVNKQNFYYEEPENSFLDYISLSKNNWGYGEYHITSDNDFVQPEHKIIWAEDFVGNSYSLPFYVDVDKMIAGKNYARITISSINQKIEVMIEATAKSRRVEGNANYLKQQKSIGKLMHLYLSFCMGHMEMEDYISQVKSVIGDMENSGISLMTQLFRVHMGILSHREGIVKDGLAMLETQEERMRTNAPAMYCAYLYLCGIWTDDEEQIESYVREIESYYQKEPDNWRYLWFLLYLSPVYQSERRKFEDIISQLERGCHSPILFLEICSILNDSPEQLKELTPGIKEAIHWGCKQGFIQQELALRYSYLAGKERDYSEGVCKDLCRIYEQFPEDEVLMSICKILMKGQITSHKAFYWYNLGVERGLKLTDLYEYYMYTITETEEIQLQKSTLLYFLYDNHLTIGKKAMLFAYIIKNKKEFSDEYEAYRQVMEDFMLKQLQAGRINTNLAVIYEEFIREDCINEFIAEKLPDIMFSHEIICENPNIVGVYVMHRELKEEEFVPLVNGRAIVQIFTEHDEIFLADSLDNRYVSSVEYTSNKLLHLDHLAESILEYNKEHPYLLLHICDRADRMNKQGREIMEVRRQVLHLTQLSDYYYKKSFCALIRYYYENFESEQLDEALEELEWEMVHPSERKQFVEYCVVRRFFPQAMEGILTYGYEKISAKHLLKAASDCFLEQMDEENPALLKLAWHIFTEGQFDENMLRYLCKHYNGKTQNMIEIWRYAKGFSLDMADLSERILGQILFTDEMPLGCYEVFYDYYASGQDKQLIQSFLKYMAYKYLVFRWILPSQMFAYFYREAKIRDNIFCLIASLKYLSQQDSLEEEEREFADYHLNKLYEENMVFPFFKDFYGKLSLPIHILDELYVEYITNPAYEVKIHYLISSGYEKGEYITESMRDVFQGIRVKEFVLFQDEILQYYISEIRPEGEVITKSATVSFDETMDSERTSSKYHMLNLMMISQEMNDENTLLDLMNEYVEMEECVAELFVPIHEEME